MSSYEQMYDGMRWRIASRFEESKTLDRSSSSWVLEKERIRSLFLCCEEVLGPVDPRDVIYTKTRLRVLSTDQSLRRPLNRKEFTRTANCFIGRHPGTCNTFTRAPCVFSILTNVPGRMTFWIAAPNTCAAFDALHPPINASIWLSATHEETGSSGMEPGRSLAKIQVQSYQW
ncbi:hypothetical protein TNCV_3258871 [Trichonephila clavipes]|nr:hypothetical protein TNCV_3258871 [Trichonephila clavipes]